jgi:hypothetical protein
MYPDRQATTHTGLRIFGKVEDLEQRGLKHVRFCESFGAQSLTIEEPQDPLLHTVQDEEHPLVQLELTSEQAQALRDSLRSRGLQLLPIPPYDSWLWGEIGEPQIFSL